MRDIGYINIDFETSINKVSIDGNNDLKSLKQYKSYADGAIDYHIKDENPNQVEFFTKISKYAEKKIKKLEKLHKNIE